MNNINVFYNYYSDRDAERKSEIDSCLKKLVENDAIGTLYVITESELSLPWSSEKTVKVQLDERPSFQTIFSFIADKSSEDDVNVILNSDCFFEETDGDYIRSIGEKVAFCLSRIEINSAYPLKIKKLKTIRNWMRRSDMQDCWIFKGKPEQSMWLDFYMGKPGCDNRLAYEFQNAGYSIVNPRTEISIYHFHCTELRRYSISEQIPEPYAYPEISDKTVISRILFR